jgi:hypothetical protein
VDPELGHLLRAKQKIDLAENEFDGTGIEKMPWNLWELSVVRSIFDDVSSLKRVFTLRANQKAF